METRYSLCCDKQGPGRIQQRFVTYGYTGAGAVMVVLIGRHDIVSGRKIVDRFVQQQPVGGDGLLEVLFFLLASGQVENSVRPRIGMRHFLND